MQEKAEQLKLANTDEKKNLLMKAFWGPDAHCYSNHYWLPKGTAWEDVYGILATLNPCSLSVYLRVDESSFVHYSDEHIRADVEKARKRQGQRLYALIVSESYFAFDTFREQGCKDGWVCVDLDLTTSGQIIARTVIQEGDCGDKNGFGVEPDIWVSAILNHSGAIVEPFAMGYNREGG